MIRPLWTLYQFGESHQIFTPGFKTPSAALVVLIQERFSFLYNKCITNTGDASSLTLSVMLVVNNNEISYNIPAGCDNYQTEYKDKINKKKLGSASSTAWHFCHRPLSIRVPGAADRDDIPLTMYIIPEL